MRVVAGQFKGHPLRSPRGTTRPTLDRVREAVFSMLGPLGDLAVLDLYAGSGALGIEALSRGATSASFVDSDAAAVKAIGDNLQRTRAEGGRITRSDALVFLRNAARHAQQWDLVLCDPPYRLAARLGEPLSRMLEPVLAPGARVVCESSHRQPLELDLPLEKERRYGDVRIAVYSGG
jgi:16S rRNA (guanine(966)-N(2))-methyltransferase RsmD